MAFYPTSLRADGRKAKRMVFLPRHSEPDDRKAKRSVGKILALFFLLLNDAPGKLSELPKIGIGYDFHD